ncbi:MAG TPA: hypothetical protein VH643_00815 [Gemmataceae bacterium]|jgi:hypothetical protein
MAIISSARSCGKKFRCVAPQSGWAPIRPCPICLHNSWCSKSADGSVIICRREPTGCLRQKFDRNGNAYYVHRGDGVAVPFWLLHDASSVGRAAAADLDTVYTFLLRQLDLSDAHRQNLEERGITDIGSGYKTLPRYGRERIAAVVQEFFLDRLISIGRKIDPDTGCYHRVYSCLLDRDGRCPLLKVPGFVIKDGDLTIAGASGIVIPVRDFAGQIVALKVRSDNADSDSKYTYISSRNYGGPGPGSPLHFPLGFAGADPTVIRITEGELKADIAFLLTGIPTIGIPGVGSWKAAVDWLSGSGPHIHEKILLAWDRDYETKEDVGRTLRACAKSLVAIGYNAVLEEWSTSTRKDCQ